MSMGNARSKHQQNLSIHSIASLVEPMTPPDFNDHHTNADHTSSTPVPVSHLVTEGNGLYNNSNQSPGATPLSSLNTNIGGNTFRSRLKSLPLVTELDQKFNQFSINSLQTLSQEPSHGSSQGKAQSQPHLYQAHQQISSTQYSQSSSSSSIPQITLQQYHTLKNPTSSQVRGQRGTPSPPSQRFSSNGSIQYSEHEQSNSVPSVSSSNSSTTTNSNYKNYDELNLIPIENLDILKLSVDQYGCRYLQKKLEIDNSIKDIIFNKIFNNIIDLIVDPFGNYLIQKLVDYLTTYQKSLMIEKIHSYVFLISINQYGTRSLQKIIDKVTNFYQMDLIVKGLQMNDTSNPVEDNNVVKLIKDLNGNHVIQKCIFKFPPEKFRFIIDSICLNNNIVRISTHKHGCCVLQKLLNNANFEQIIKISKVLLVYLDDLVNDQFGNYIIQFLFELNFLKNTAEISLLIDEFFSKIYQKLVQLSCLKFSSNVIEKFIKILKVKQNYGYLNEIIKLINLNFELLIKDKFGNYVIQTLIDQFYDVTELNMEMSILINTVKNSLPVIKAAPYARKIQLKIQQLESSYGFSSDPRISNPNTHINAPLQMNRYVKQAGFDPQLQQQQQLQQQMQQQQMQMQQQHMNFSNRQTYIPNYTNYAAYPNHPQHTLMNNSGMDQSGYANY